MHRASKRNHHAHDCQQVERISGGLVVRVRLEVLAAEPVLGLRVRKPEGEPFPAKACI